jgi:hypothetical protein
MSSQTMAATQPASTAAARRARPDIVSLVGGIGILVLGVVLLLDALGALDLRFAGLAPVACAAAGGVLVARGLVRDDELA